MKKTEMRFNKEGLSTFSFPSNMQRAGLPVRSSKAITPNDHTSTASYMAETFVLRFIPDTAKQ
jgi:hypothetical protein